MDEEISGGGDGGAGGGYSSSWRPNYSRGVELGPPAFLTKTYTIVDDPNTNSIISWGKYGNSFIIWDHLTFSAEILPKYFKHSNLSSFVYQLNSYGFRKIGVEHQWEYSNQGFQKGELHLLKSIRRRGQNLENVARKRGKRTISDRNVSLEIMMNEINESKMEIKKMKSQQADMEFHIMALEEEAKNADDKMKKLIACLGKACDIIAEKMREETGKQNNDDEGKDDTKFMDINHEKNDQDQEKMMKLADAAPLYDQNQTVSSTNENDDHEANAINSEPTQEKNLLDYAYWNSILLGDDDDGGDDEACEGEGETETAKKKAKIELEFEKLIIKLEGYE
ncbi:hypothetical protein ACS0TY_031943 [Phlomoides rotata]